MEKVGGVAAADLVDCDCDEFVTGFEVGGEEGFEVGV